MPVLGFTSSHSEKHSNKKLDQCVTLQWQTMDSTTTVHSDAKEVLQ